MGANQSDTMEDLEARRKTLDAHLNDLEVQLSKATANNLNTDEIYDEKFATMITLAELINKQTELIGQQWHPDDGIYIFKNTAIILNNFIIMIITIYMLIIDYDFLSSVYLWESIRLAFTTLFTYGTHPVDQTPAVSRPAALQVVANSSSTITSPSTLSTNIALPLAQSQLPLADPQDNSDVEGMLVTESSHEMPPLLPSSESTTLRRRTVRSTTTH